MLEQLDTNNHGDVEDLREVLVRNVASKLKKESRASKGFDEDFDTEKIAEMVNKLNFYDTADPDYEVDRRIVNEFLKGID